MINNATVQEILDDGVIYTTPEGGEARVQGAEFIIVALGSQSVDELSEEIKTMVQEVHVTGDAQQVARILEATAGAAEIARHI